MKAVKTNNRQISNRFDLFFENKARIKSEIHLGLSLIGNERLREASSHIFSAGGKMLRSSLLAITYKAVGGRYVERILPIAAAIEIIHNWSLVHDDIIDKSKLRRGVSTVHEKWDRTTAILSGDTLNNLAYLLITRSDIDPLKIKRVIQCIAETSLVLIEGEMMDIEFENREEVTEEEYFEMIKRKTGALIKSAVSIGAILGTDDQAVIKEMEAYGEKIGIAFQIKDDIVDLTGNEEELGKDFAGDIKEGKRTLLIIHALQHALSQKSRRLKEIITSKKTTKAEVLEAIGIIKESKSFDHAKGILMGLTEEAFESLDNLPGSHYVNALYELGDFIRHTEKIKVDYPLYII